VIPHKRKRRRAVKTSNPAKMGQRGGDTSEKKPPKAGKLVIFPNGTKHQENQMGGLGWEKKKNETERSRKKSSSYAKTLVKNRLPRVRLRPTDEEAIGGIGGGKEGVIEQGTFPGQRPKREKELGIR